MSIFDFDWSGEKILAKRKSDGQHSLEDFAVRATLGEGGFGKVELVKSQGSTAFLARISFLVWPSVVRR